MHKSIYPTKKSRLLITGWARIRISLSADKPTCAMSRIATAVLTISKPVFSRAMTDCVSRLICTASRGSQHRYLVRQSPSRDHSHHCRKLIYWRQAMTQFATVLLLIIYDALASPWFTAHIRDMLQAFYHQPNIKTHLIYVKIAYSDIFYSVPENTAFHAKYTMKRLLAEGQKW